MEPWRRRGGSTKSPLGAPPLVAGRCPGHVFGGHRGRALEDHLERPGDGMSFEPLVVGRTGLACPTVWAAGWLEVWKVGPVVGEVGEKPEKSFKPMACAQQNGFWPVPIYGRWGGCAIFLLLGGRWEVSLF